MAKPKIKEKLPEKLPPVEQDTKGEMEVTEEKVGQLIEEEFIEVKEDVIQDPDGLLKTDPDEEAIKLTGVPE